MFRQMYLVMVLFVSCLSAPAYAGSFDLSLGDEAAQVKYLYDTAQLGIGGADRGFGLFFNENDDILGSYQFLVTGNVVGTNRSVQLGAGLKAYAGLLDMDREDLGLAEEDPLPAGVDILDDVTIGAIGIGGRLNFILPSKMPMGVYVELYIAPDITSFGDIEQLTEVNVGYEVEVAPSTRLYVGYRMIEVDVEAGIQGYELDDSVHLGVRVTF